MTKNQRKTLFFACFFLFFLFAPAAVLFSQGYRIDLTPKEGGKFITQTGGIFLKAFPRQAEIYTDGKLKDKTDFFFGSVLLENLLPGEYQIEVAKEGFHSWQKRLEAREKEVVEAKSIVLFPEDINYEAVATSVESFYFDENLKEIVLEKKDGKKMDYFILQTNRTPLSLIEIDKPLNATPTEEYSFSAYQFKKDGEILSLYDDEEKKYQRFFQPLKGLEVSPDLNKLVYFSDYEIWIFSPREENEKKFLLRLSEKITNCQWLNSDYIIFNSGNKIKITETDDRDRLNIIDILEIKNAPQGQIRIFWDKISQKLYILNQGELGALGPIILP